MSNELNAIPYQNELFINREAQISQIMLAIQRPLPDKACVLALVGPRGSGKTWLMDHLRNKLKDDKRVKCARLDFEPLRQGNHGDAFARAVLGEFAREVEAQAGNISSGEQVPLARWGEWLIQDVRRITQEHTLVVFMDSVYETPDEDLKALEEAFLGALGFEGKVIIIMAGYGAFPLWQARELARARVIELGPFELSDLETLIQKKHADLPPKTVTEKAHTLYEWTGGYPLAAGRLLDVIPAETVADQGTIKASLLKVLAHTLKPLVDQHFSQIALESFLQDYMVLAVLRAFDEDRLSALMACDSARASLLMDQLLSSNLVVYKKEQRGYVLDPGIRYLWDRLARTRWQEKWEELHKRAVELYTQWAGQYRATASFWEEEAAYHLEQLRLEKEEIHA